MQCIGHWPVKQLQAVDRWNAGPVHLESHRNSPFALSLVRMRLLKKQIVNISINEYARCYVTNMHCSMPSTLPDWLPLVSEIISTMTDLICEIRYKKEDIRRGWLSYKKYSGQNRTTDGYSLFCIGIISCLSNDCNAIIVIGPNWQLLNE